MAAMVVGEEGFGGTLALVVAGAWTDGVHITPIGLGLGVDRRVAVDLAGGSLEDAGVAPFGHPKGVDSPHDGGLHGLDGVVLVVTRGGWAGEVVDFVDFEPDRVGDIVTDEVEVVVLEQVLDIGLLGSEEVIETDDIVPLAEEAFAEMRSEEARAARNKYPFDGHVSKFLCSGLGGRSCVASFVGDHARVADHRVHG